MDCCLLCSEENGTSFSLCISSSHKGKWPVSSRLDSSLQSSQRKTEEKGAPIAAAPGVEIGLPAFSLSLSLLGVSYFLSPGCGVGSWQVAGGTFMLDKLDHVRSHLYHKHRHNENIPETLQLRPIDQVRRWPTSNRYVQITIYNSHIVY